MIRWFREYALLIISIVFLFAVVGIALAFYSNVGLPMNSENWGDLGSYLSGTIGLAIAILAVIWLIQSVQLQKTELNQLKAELKATGEEQRKQTQIAALSAIISANESSMTRLENSLIALNSGDQHLMFGEDKRSIELEIYRECKSMLFYRSQLETYLQPDSVYEPHNDPEITLSGFEFVKPEPEVDIL